MKRLTAFLPLLAFLGVILAGCNKAADEGAAATPAVTSAQQGGANSAKTQSGGGVPDETIYQAPTGVQRGVLPGGAR